MENCATMRGTHEEKNTFKYRPIRNENERKRNARSISENLNVVPVVVVEKLIQVNTSRWKWSSFIGFVSNVCVRVEYSLLTLQCSLLILSYYNLCFVQEILIFLFSFTIAVAVSSNISLIHISEHVRLCKHLRSL